MKLRRPNPFRSHASTAAAAMAIVFNLFAIPSAFATIYYWDNDGATPGFGMAAGTWAAPTTGDATQGWSEDSAGTTEPVDVTTTGSDIAIFGTDTVGLGAGTINVSGTVSAERVDFSAASGAITLAGGTINLTTDVVSRAPGMTINSNIAISGNASFITAKSGAINVNMTTTLGGIISGTGDVTFTNQNTNLQNADHAYLLNGNSSYTGNTLIDGGGNTNTRLRVALGVNDALPVTTVVTLDGRNGTGTSPGRFTLLQLNGNNQTIAGLTNVSRTLRVQEVRGPGTLTINNTGDFTFSGRLDGTSGALNLVKTGSGTQTLTGSLNNYTGTTTITEGRLRGVVGGDIEKSAVTLGALGIYGVLVTDNTQSWRCGAFTPSAAGTLEFDFGAITPSDTVSPLIVTAGTSGTGVADFSTATPLISVLVDSPLLPGTYPLMTWDSSSGTPPTTADLTVSTVSGGTAASLSITGNTLNLEIVSTITNILKANNATDLSIGTSWVSTVTPGPTQVAKWDSTVTAANTTVLGADLTWAGIAIDNPAGLVTIGGGNTLTLGAAALDIDMSTIPVTPADLILACPIALGEFNTWDVAASRNLTLSGAVSGAFGFTKQGDGTAILSSSANSYTGITSVSAGTLRLGASNVIPHGAGGVASNVVVDGTLDLNGKSDSINGLSGSGVIDNTGAATSTLSVGNNGQTTTFNGVIQSSLGNLNLTKTGNGTLTLGGANTFTGTVTLVPSTSVLALANTAPLDNVTEIIMGGGTALRSDVDDTVITAPITIGAVGTTTTINASDFDGSGTTPVPFTIGGAISGDGDLTLSGIEATNSYGAIHLNAASNYAGSTLITTESGFGGPPNNANIFVKLFAENALPTTTVVTLDGGDGGGSGVGRYCELNLNGNNQTLAGLTNVEGLASRLQRVVNSNATDATLTVNNGADYTYSGQLGWTSGVGSAAYSNFALSKSGAGTLTLAGICTYTGATTISGGALALGATDVLDDTNAVSIGNAALAIGAGFTDTVGTLELTGTAAVNLGDATSALVFADSSTIPWTGSLNITGTFVSGSSLNFGSSTGLTPAQLASISATGFTGFGLDGSGFLTATGSGGFASWITGTFANGTVPGGLQGPNQDADNDGISNLVEYAVDGQDPTVPNTSVGSFAANVLSFTKRPGTSGLTYAIQQSTDLGITNAWAEVPAGPSYTNNATTISYTLTPGSPVKNFTRLQVLSN